jgi:lipopolysaccharide export system ATP-binding protein
MSTDSTIPPKTPPKSPAKIKVEKQAPKREAVKTEAAKAPVGQSVTVQAAPAAVQPPVAKTAPPPARVEPQVVDLSPRPSQANGAQVNGPQANGAMGAGPRLVASNSGLVASHLGKQFKRRPVLRDVTVSVQRGEAVGLLGPNGAGKTTCFYIITGLINADTGTIEMDGVDITHLPMYRRSRMGIGYLPQEASIFRGLTVEENIRAVLEVVEPERDMREATLDDLLAEFSISHLRRTPALALSGGERRRVEIARALASRPQFMLLDEPLAGIDPIAVGEIRELIWHLRKRGIGVLITDHNVRETLDIVDRAYILHDGTVLMDGRPSEIVAHQDVRRVYLGERFSL